MSDVTSHATASVLASTLSAEVKSLRFELRLAKESLVNAHVSLTAQMEDNKTLRRKVHEMENDVAEIRAAIQDQNQPWSMSRVPPRGWYSQQIRELRAEVDLLRDFVDMPPRTTEQPSTPPLQEKKRRT